MKVRYFGSFIIFFSREKAYSKMSPRLDVVSVSSVNLKKMKVNIKSVLCEGEYIFSAGEKISMLDGGVEMIWRGRGRQGRWDVLRP